jgi:two-component system, OmpR family, response regulator
MGEGYSTIVVNIDTSRNNSLRQLRELREATDATIIVLTYNTDEYERVLCLEIAADDYLVRPHSARELVARIHANTRRYLQALTPTAGVDHAHFMRGEAAQAPRSGKLSLPGLVFDSDGTDLTTTDGREIPLTKLELALSQLLVKAPTGKSPSRTSPRRSIEARARRTPEANSPCWSTACETN